MVFLYIRVMPVLKLNFSRLGLIFVCAYVYQCIFTLDLFAGEGSEEFENVTITFKQPLDNGK